MRILHLIRGLPGSGKTNLAKKLSSINHVEADYFHVRGDCYVFDIENLSKAHNWCLLEVERKMRLDLTPLVVSNTFTTNKEMYPYLELAKKYDYGVQVIAIENVLFESIHAVPKERIDKMKDRWESFDGEQQEEIN